MNPFPIGEGPTDKDVQSFCQRNAISLPSDYIEFLKETNGGTLPHTATCPDNKDRTALAFFCPFTGDKCSVESLYQKRGEVCIASDAFGNYFYLEPNDSVSFWDHETDLKTTVAESFSAFLESVEGLEPPSEHELPASSGLVDAIKHGFDVNGKDESGVSYARLYASRVETECLEVLWEAKADFDGVFIEALAGGFEELTITLLEWGVYTPEYRFPSGETLLHVAAEYGAVKTCRYMLDHGWNKTVEDENGNRAIHVADNDELIELLGPW